MHDVPAVGRQEVDVVVGEVHAMDRDEAGARRAQPVQSRERRRAVPLAALGDLVRGLGQVRLDRQVELPRIHDDLLERRVADRVGSMRREREREPRLVLARVAHREPRLQVAVRIGRVRRREIEDRQPEHRAKARLDVRRAPPRRERNTCRCSR